MTTAVRMQILEKFVSSTPKPTRFCHTEFVPRGLPQKEMDDLDGYHPEGSEEVDAFSVTCSIQKKDKPDAFLTITAIAGTGWNDEQIKFIKSLEFVPVPEAIVPGLQPLLMMRPMERAKRQLAGTNWAVVNAQLKKTTVNGQALDEVLLSWEHTDSDGKVDFFEPAATCWKW